VVSVPEPLLAGFRTITEHVPVDPGAPTACSYAFRASLVDKTVAITDADRAELEHRRAQIRVALAGKPYQRPCLL
jgi:hypothetical protein